MRNAGTRKPPRPRDSERLEPHRQPVDEVDARPVRIAPPAEIDTALVDVPERCVERARRREVLVDTGVEDDARHPRLARDALERLHERACRAAPAIRLLDVEVLD